MLSAPLAQSVFACGKPAVLRMGRALVSAGHPGHRGCQLVDGTADGTLCEPEASTVVAGRGAGDRPRASDGIQIYGLCPGNHWAGAVAARPDPSAARHLVLHVSGGVLYGGYLPQYRAGGKQSGLFFHLYDVFSPADRGPDCTL